MKRWCLFVCFVSTGFLTRAQQPVMSQDSLKLQILKMEQRLDNIEVNLGLSQKKFQTGMLVATIGYTVTIAGGLMLGREQDQLGQVLLVAGGATGITGTYMLVDSFKYLGRASGKKSKRR
ncbi:MAG: hypothetical protein ACK5DD_03890 [Cyclobacteriaceae bacterium]